MSSDGGLFRSPLVWAALGVGIALRAVGLFQQILVGDEIHAYHFAPKVPFPGIFWDYDHMANSPPFNAWLRLFLDLGVAPSEIALRIPVLASGIALLFVVPWWVARQFGKRTAVVAAWLLALAPLLVIYSRVMRPYMPLVLLGTTAAGAFYAWWRTRRRAAGVAYALLAAAAMYFHLLAAPFVLAPFAFLALEAGLHGRAALPPRRELAFVVGLVGALLLIIVVPAWSDLIRLVASHHQPPALGGRNVRELLLLLCGTGVPVLALLVWAAVVAGGVRLARLQPDLLRYLLVICIAQIVAAPLLSSKGINNPIVLTRYLIVLVVPILILAALGLGAAEPVRRLVTPLILAAMLVTGPLADADLYQNPFGLKGDLFRYDRRRARFRRQPPEAYRVLASGPPGVVVEHPFPPSFHLLRPLADYWDVHRRPTRIAPGGDGLNDPRLGLRSTVAGEPQPLLESGAVFLIVHRDWEGEIGAGVIPGSRSPRGRQLVVRNLDWMRREAARLTDELERRWGPPDARDDHVAIWNLARVHAHIATRPGGLRPTGTEAGGYDTEPGATPQ